MTGTALHSRTFRITSSPSMSGSPRSRMTMSGWRLATSTSPSAPVAASCTRKPWPANAARTKRRICGSSSTTTTQGSGRASATGALGRARRLAGGQGEPEDGAAVAAVLAPDASAVGLDDGAADREPEPGAAARAHAVELLEDLALLAGRQPRPAVGDVHDDLVALATGLHVDRLAAGRVLRRVLEQVDEHLLHQQAVDVHGWQVLGQPRGDLAVAQRLGQPGERDADQLFDGDPLAPELEAAGLQARDVEQVVDEAIEPLGLVADRLEQLALRDGVQTPLPLQRGAGGAGDRGERRAQVVGDRAQQRIAHALGLRAHLRRLRLVGQQRAVDRDGDLAHERLEQVLLLGR